MTMEPFISEENLNSLIEKLKNNLPYSCTMYNNLLLHTRGIIDAHQFFVLKDHPEANIIIYKGKIIKNNVGVFSRESEVELVVSALLSTALIDWENDLFCHIPIYLVPAIQSIMQQKNNEMETKIIDCDGYMIPSINDNIGCSTGFYLRILGAAGVKRLLETWKFREESTEELQNNIVVAGLAIGVYEKKNDEQHQDQAELEMANECAIPVSWMTMSVDGSLGILQTDEAYQRRGLASMVVKCCATAAVNQGYVPHVYIEHDNPTSRNLFEKLGWKKSHKASWVYPGVHKSLSNLPSS